MATAKKTANKKANHKGDGFEGAEGMSKDEILEAIRAKVAAIRDYVPMVGILGDTGVGKSSLCNALFGRKVAEVGMVEACTRDLQKITIGDDENGGIVLVDMPGVGEDASRTEEYFKSYRKLHPALDLVIWVMDVDARAYERGIRAYEEIFKPDIKRCPVVFVLSKAEKSTPMKEWDWNAHEPSKSQLNYIRDRAYDVAEKFDVSPKKICAVSAEEKFNLVELVNLIVKELPKEKRFSFVREADGENVSEKAIKEAKKGILDTVKEWLGSKYDEVKDEVVSIAKAGLAEGAKKIGKHLLKAAVNLFKWPW